MRWRVALPGLVMVCAAVGCRRQEPAQSKLPVTSSQSAALPGATNAADAPEAPQVAESGRADLTTYRDPAAGVSFQYPTVWRPAVAGQSPVAPAFEQVAGKARITQEFLPDGNYYAPTVLRALMFSYTVKEVSNASQCSDLAKKAVPGAASVKQANYRGQVFNEVSGGDAGMCTQVRTQIDTASRGQQCFVFERDFVTSCPYVKTQSTPRPLTGQERAALQRHLDGVMESVQIAAP